jgi:LL-diaminopimelate aminotransferase
LTGPQDHVDLMRAIYQKRRDAVVAAFQEVGLGVEPPLGSIYVWVPTPTGRSSAEFSQELLEDAAVVVSPGTGYGRYGEGFVRISLTVPDERLDEALARIRERLR